MQKGPYPGTTYEKSRRRWKAQGRINGLQKSLGYFSTQAEAYEAVLRAKEAARATQEGSVDPGINSLALRPAESLKDATVAQSNVLIERPWAMTLLEARIFVLLLSALRREEIDNQRITVALADLMGPDPIGGRGYQLLHAALDSLDAVRIELPMPSRQKDWHKVPLVHSLQLDSGQGTVSGYFSADVLPYLTNLVDNFTLGQVADLLSIKNPTTYRWYWLLKSWEYRSPITVQVDRLRELTTGVDSYPQFTEYRRSVLKPAVDELNRLNFVVTYREHKVGRSVASVEFYISTKPKPVAKPRQLVLALAPAPASAVEAVRRAPLTTLEAKVSTRLGKLQLTEAQTSRVLATLAGNAQQLELLLKRTYPLLRDLETRSKTFENVGATTVALLKSTFPNLYQDALKVQKSISL